MLEIEILRKKIEQIDASIIEKIARRDELSKQIGLLKLTEGMQVVDLSREAQLFKFYDCLCDQYHLPKTFIKQLFKSIMIHSRTVQQ